MEELRERTPEGIYQVCKKYYYKYHLPIDITENGVSDRHDKRRPRRSAGLYAQICINKELTREMIEEFRIDP